jgi:hypothetical protein
VAFVFLVFAACSPWTMYSAYMSFNGVWTSFGVGPFVAGASTNFFAYRPYQYYSGVVWWSDLHTENVCSDNTTDLFTKWADPHGLWYVVYNL